MKNPVCLYGSRLLRAGTHICLFAALMLFASVLPAQQLSELPSISPDPLNEIRELRQRLEKCEAQLQQRPVESTPPSDMVLTSLPPTDPLPKADGKASSLVEKSSKAPSTITKPTFKINGKVFLDNFIFSQSAANASVSRGVGQVDDYTGFREMRLQAGGDLFANMDYTLEYDLSGNLGVNNVENQNGVASAIQQTSFKNVYSTIKDLPVIGNLRIGHFKEPLGMDQLTGDEFTTFIERALPEDVLAPGRRIGLMAFGYIADDDNASYYLGTFREGFADTQVFERSNEGDWSIVGRLAWLPYYDLSCDSLHLIHVGAAGEFTGTNANRLDAVQFTARPESRPTQNFIGTPVIEADDFWRYGVEGLVIAGPFSVQSEFTGVSVNRIANTPVHFDGFYAQASYFLTGESQGYDKERKTPGRVVPFAPFITSPKYGLCQGRGAWQVAVRYSFLDLRDANIQGGRLDDFTMALNWYLNSNCELMFNYIHSEVDRAATIPTAGIANADSNVDIFGIRWQFTF